MKEKLIAWGIDILVVVAFFAIPFGAFMTYYTQNSWWAWLCVLLVFFL